MCVLLRYQQLFYAVETATVQFNCDQNYKINDPTLKNLVDIISVINIFLLLVLLLLVIFSFIKKVTFQN